MFVDLLEDVFDNVIVSGYSKDCKAERVGERFPDYVQLALEMIYQEEIFSHIGLGIALKTAEFVDDALFNKAPLLVVKV